jgi:plasmid stability protein
MIVRASPWDRQAEVRTKISDAEFKKLEALAEKHGCSVYEMAREMIRAALALASREPNGAAVADGDPLGTAGERLGATRTRAPGKARSSGAADQGEAGDARSTPGRPTP